MTNEHNNHHAMDDLNEPDAMAKPLAHALNTHAQQLNMRVLTRLEQARQQAIATHTQLTSEHQAHRDGTLSGLFAWGQHHRFMTAGLLSVALLAGIMLAQRYEQQFEQGDAFLLGAELPPEAFIDRGFEPWLNAKAEF